MKVVGIVGSPRKSGNTAFLMKQALTVLEREKFEVEMVELGGLFIKPCEGCLSCKTNLECAITDDDFHKVFSKMKEADGLIIGTPVYFGSATPQLMGLLDRAAYLQRQNKQYFSGKAGGPIVVARRAGHDFTLAQLLLWYFINDMVIVGSTYWNIAFGGSAGKRDVHEDQEGLETINHFALNLAKVLKALNNT